jgi:hypothetical protein
MSSALPQPEPDPAAATAPGEPPAPKPSLLRRQYKPVGKLFIFCYDMFRLFVWATIAVWVNPKLLDWIGGHGVGVWLEHHMWVRVLGAPPLFVLAFLSALEIKDTAKQRSKLAGVAGGLGGTVGRSPAIDPTYGMSDGPALRIPVGSWSMSVRVWKEKSRRRTVAQVQLDALSEFSFAARGAAREPLALRGLQQRVAGAAMRGLAERGGDPRAAVVAHTLTYLGEAPIRIGDPALDAAVVLRSNQPDAARALFGSGPVTRAVGALAARTSGWDWTLYPVQRAGSAEMKLECPGALDDGESLREIQQLLRAALEHLAERGAIGR